MQISKQAEGEALSNNQTFDAISYFWQHTPDILYVCSFPHREILYINKSFSDIFGYTTDEIDCRNLNDLVAFFLHPDDVSNFAHFLEKLHQSPKNEIVSIECRFKHKNGNYLWQYIREMIIERDPLGEPLKSIGIQENIQERKTNEISLSSSLHLYKTIVESQDDIICRFLPDLTLTFVNKNYANLWGYEPAEVIGMPLTHFLRPDQPEKVKNYLASFSPSKPFSKEIEFSITPKGIVWFEWATRAFFNKEDEITEFQSVGRDITKQYQTELELRENETLLKESQKIANIGSWLYRIDEQKAKFSDGFFDILKICNPYEKKLVTHNLKIIFQRLSLQDRWQLKRKIIAAYRHHQESQYEFCYIISSGEEIYINIILKPHIVENKTLWLYGIIQDITFRKKRETELLLAKKRAEEAVASKQHFLSTMSHEIRNPLNAIIGITRLLLESHLGGEIQENLKNLKFSADNLLAIINNVLDINRIESGKIELERVPLNIKNLVERIKESHKYLAIQKNIDLKLIIDADIPTWVIGDPIRLTQVLNNLIGNAIKFTEKGFVKIEVLLVNETFHTAQIKFSVSDTGIGIPSEKIPYIFDSFTQGDSSTTRKFGGSGLGLAISKKILELYHSSIQVESKVNQGSTFSFEIIFNKCKEDSKPHQQYSVSIPEDTIRKDCRVLLVEDNAVNRLVATRFLNQLGIQPDIAETGKEALQKVLQNHYDVVLMDLQMPEMNGFEATQAIRQQIGIYYKKLPIIALTADAMPETKEKIHNYLMNGLLTKPFTPEQLFEVIRPYIQEKLPINFQKLCDKTDHRLAKEYDFQIQVSELYIKLFEEYQLNACHAVQKNQPEIFRFYTHKIKTAIQLLELQELDKLTQEIKNYLSCEKIDSSSLQNYTSLLNNECQKIIAILNQNIEQLKLKYRSTP
ncbi:MAG: PAS domain S-box protein [Cytophagales bacterium]|nr:PAS domain S-box protein [Cytophagales bacterium]MDW8383719.1 PAS domain S-box protein [Flammeovirgaceae bacterium]